MLMIGGGFAMATSLLWEYVRMAPDYRFIVEPWSLRGYELTQGWVMFALGVGVMALGVASARDETPRRFALGVAGATWLAAVLIAEIPDPRPVVFDPSGFTGLIILGLLSLFIARIIINAIGDRRPERMRGLQSIGLWLLLFVIAVIVAGTLDETLTIRLSVMVGIVFAIVLTFLMTAPPEDMAVSRIAIFATLAVILVALTIGAGTRTHLLEEQLKQSGVAARYRESQITSGLIIVMIASIVAWVGSVGLWARKRDLISARTRARRQLAAAKESAAEIEEAVT